MFMKRDIHEGIMWEEESLHYQRDIETNTCPRKYLDERSINCVMAGLYTSVCLS